MNLLTYVQIRELFSSGHEIDFATSFDAAESCNRILSNAETQESGRELIIRALDAWESINTQTHHLWTSLIEKSGLYTYLQDRQMVLPVSTALSLESHHSKFLPGDIYLHEEQLLLSTALEGRRSVVLSAPTSFGKSLLIEEVVSSRKYKNIVIIQPTLALLDETRKKLRKYSDYYNIIISTSQSAKENNLFLLTAERVVEYNDLPNIDFFVIDEFYKLSMQREDDRAISLNYALYKLLKHTHNFYMLGPNVHDVSPIFLEQHNCLFHNTRFSTVAVDIQRIESGKKRDERERALFELLTTFHEPTLIYCSSPDKANELLQSYAATLNGVQGAEQPEPDGEITELVEWIKMNIHPQWFLADGLKKGMGVHHGSLPRHLGSTIVDLFNDGLLQYLFCTSTLMEGVNTVAKNVVLFDKKKGPKPMDFFDYKNIVGRSGRMKIYYTGKVWQFYPDPAQMEIDLEIPLFDQQNAPLELLIQLEDADLSDSARQRMERLPIEEELKKVIKSNVGFPFEGQSSLFDYMDSQVGDLDELLNWNRIPSFNQLARTLELAFQFLLKPREAGRVSPRQLTLYTLQYYEQKSLVGIINRAIDSQFWKTEEPDDYRRIQVVVSEVFHIAKHWFDFKLPSLLNCMHKMQVYVFELNGYAAGDYTYFISELERKFLPSNLSILLEYDVPSSALMQLKSKISQNELNALDVIRTLNLSELGLLPYEIRKLKEIL
ncbi:DEAD/DEAH box helicase [bacterium]|nr:DEAD/DEAH box helicase [bacterium]